MFDFIGEKIFPKQKVEESEISNRKPFTFGDEDTDPYQYPTLYEEADEMLNVSMLIYSLTDLRNLAKHSEKKKRLKSAEKILEMPLSLHSCLQVLNDNYDVMRETWGEKEHFNTMNSMNLIHERFQKHRESSLSSSGNSSKLSNFVSIASLTRSGHDVEDQEVKEPMLTYFGDENSDTDMVYAIGIDERRKRIILAFRGSVTTTDFQKDAMISLIQQPNPVHDLDSDQNKEIGLHHGFYDYLLKPRENDRNKFQEIMEHVKSLFLEYERNKTYKLYVTGHSLGGALATLFSLHAAASNEFREGIIPSPVSCISVASPRVGDREFLKAFCRLEERGNLRHLRIANDGDPVTMMPSATSKKILALFSPMFYIVNKLIDNEFEEKQMYFHTGVKLGLAKSKWEIAFKGSSIADSEREEAVETDRGIVTEQDESRRSLGNFLSSSTKSKSKGGESKRNSTLPNVAFHLGDAYTENLSSVKDELLVLSLNDLYKEREIS